jgi:hypothetical protein
LGEQVLELLAGKAALAAWRQACWELKPSFLTQYATVDGARPVSRAIDSGRKSPA